LDPTVWSDWLKEGYFVSYQSTVDAATRKYFFITRREWSHYEYVWPEDVAPGVSSGPFTVADLENTSAPEKQLWQLVFGVNKQVYLYTHVPTDVDRHGVAKKPKQTAALRQVGHYEPGISPWHQPSWLTEHFLIRPDTPFIAVSCFNRAGYAWGDDGYGDYRAITFHHGVNPIKLNFHLAKLELEKIGEETEGKLTPSDFPKLQVDPRTGVGTSLETGEVINATASRLRNESRYYECLENLYRRLIPQRPITLTPVRAPATAT